MMTDYEKKLHDIVGQTNPFRVPEGYFENFEARLAQRLPQKETRRSIRLRPWYWRYAAALVVLVGVGSALFWNQYRNPSFTLSEEASQEEYYNDELDYIMVNNMEIAEYLTEAD